MKKIQAIEEEENEEQYNEDDHTLVTSDVRELLVIREPFTSKGFPMNLAKGIKSFTGGALLEARYVARPCHST